MRTLHRFVLLVITSAMFSQCQRELSYVGTGDSGQVVLPSPLTANLQGNILDENGQPAANVVIKVGSEITATDTKGYFRINKAPLDKNAALVVADKTGYFTAYRSFSATSGTNQVVIKLTKKTMVTSPLNSLVVQGQESRKFRGISIHNAKPFRLMWS